MKQNHSGVDQKAIMGERERGVVSSVGVEPEVKPCGEGGPDRFNHIPLGGTED